MKTATMSLRAAVTGVALAVLAFAGCDKVTGGDDEISGNVLRIYTWPAYIDQGVVESFERSHDCQVLIDNFSSNEEMFSQLKEGGANYDIVMPSSYYVSMLVKAGLLQPLDITQLPNIQKNFDHSFDNQVHDHTFAYSVPYAVTYTGFFYVKSRIPKSQDVATWSILGSDRFKGRISFLDDIREVIGAGLMSLGYSVNSVNQSEIDQAVNVVLSWCRNLRKFDSETYKMEVAAGTTWIGQGYSSDAWQVIFGDETEEMPPQPTLGFALPREGFTIAFDEMVLCKGARNTQLAYAFMNYLYEELVAKENMMRILTIMPVKPGIDTLDPVFREHVIPPPEVLSKGQIIQPIDDIPGAMEMYAKAWDRIKSAQSRMMRPLN